MNASPILVVVGVIVILFVCLNYFSRKQVSDLRARGIMPQEGQEKEEDIPRLLQAGQKIMAIKVYRALHGVGLKEAKDAVEELEKRLPRQR